LFLDSGIHTISGSTELACFDKADFRDVWHLAAGAAPVKKLQGVRLLACCPSLSIARTESSHGIGHLLWQGGGSQTSALSFGLCVADSVPKGLCAAASVPNCLCAGRANEKCVWCLFVLQHLFRKAFVPLLLCQIVFAPSKRE
jgi:hypothetical protein